MKHKCGIEIFGICGAYSAPAAAVKFLKPLLICARLYEKRGGDICQAHGVISMTYIITDFICRCLNKFLELIHIVCLRNIKWVKCSSSDQVRDGKRSKEKNLNKA